MSFSNDDVNLALNDNLDWLLEEKLGLVGARGPGKTWNTADGMFRIMLASRPHWEQGKSNGHPPAVGDDLISLIQLVKGIPYGAAKTTAIDWLKEVEPDFRLPAGGHIKPAQHYASFPVPPAVLEKAKIDGLELASQRFCESLVKHPPRDKKFTAAWLYRDAGGLPLFIRARYDHWDSAVKDKAYLTLAYFGLNWGWQVCSKRKNGTFQLLQPDQRYPLYNQHLIFKQQPPNFLIVVEGEKTADAAQRLFDAAGYNWVAVAWPNGAESAHRCDFLPCRALKTIHWPDRDKAGLKAISAVVAQLARAGAGDVGVVDAWKLPVRDGWDLADYDPEVDKFDPLQVIVDAGVRPPWEREAADKYFVVTAMDGYFIFQIEEENINNQPQTLLLPRSRREFCDLENRYTVQALNPMNSRLEPMRRGDALLATNVLPEKRRVVFDPNHELPISLYYNTFQGLGCEPAEGEPEHTLAFIRDLLGSKELSDYFLNLLAYKLQNLDKPGEVVIGLLGSQGAGKSFLIEIVSRLFGRHSFTASSASQIIGMFNGHLQYKLFLGVEEAIHWTDKKAWASFKTLVTAHEIPYHHKNRTIIMDKNMMLTMMASNEDHLFNAREKERRYLPIRVKDVHLQDTRYFKALRRKIQEGELRQLMGFLLRREIGDFHPLKDLVYTAELEHQKDESLLPHEEWWVEVLEDWDAGFVHTMAANSGAAPTATVYDHYLRAMERVRELRPLTKRKFGNWLAGVYGAALERNLPRYLDGRKQPDKCWVFPKRTVLVEGWNKRGGSQVAAKSGTEQEQTEIGKDKYGDGYVI